MSTFNGEIAQIPGISVDHFECCQQNCYFLSHCHTDHMKGLSELQTDAPVYMTTISALFVNKKYPDLKINIKTLEYDLPVVVEDKGVVKSFVVTALSAGHCAGSCMFLFQLDNCNILYTGDFRISLKNRETLKLIEDIKKHSNFVLYIDSTFFNQSYPEFPSQSESCVKITNIIETFLSRSKIIQVHIHTPARYGYERLIIEIGLKLKMKTLIHEAEIFEQYLRIPQIASSVTMDHQETRISLKPKFVSSLFQENTKGTDNVLNLHLSAMFWSNWDGGSFVRKISENSFRVCYATHNSFNEIKDFVLSVKPKEVYLNVMPNSFEERNIMLKQLDMIKSQYLQDKKKQQTLDRPIFSFKRLRRMHTTEASEEET
ncbi:CLUMA_CG016399, isoform A [Clunio marinus]|uniref:Protein artemis n=1 Tax=Clunio marinus TaxID=568069 RepID=A0A1J1ITZ8_9DIPT|nr:CLUMA_CG016399, isoform A [Clunio marinus]